MIWACLLHDTSLRNFHLKICTQSDSPVHNCSKRSVQMQWCCLCRRLSFSPLLSRPHPEKFAAQHFLLYRTNFYNENPSPRQSPAPALKSRDLLHPIPATAMFVQALFEECQNLVLSRLFHWWWKQNFYRSACLSKNHDRQLAVVLRFWCNRNLSLKE